MNKFALLILFCFPLLSVAQKVTLTTELRNFSEISLLPAYRSSTIPGEISTCDPTGGNDDGFAGTYSFVKRNPDSSLVMLDIDGPGVLNRIATPTPTKDTLDFYIDNKDKPALSVSYRDLFSGKVYPFTGPLCGHAVGGYYCYFPILFQKQLKIVSRGHTLQFHQLQYLLIEKGTVVNSFSPVLDESEQLALEQVWGSWQNIAATVSGKSITSAVTLAAGQSQKVFDVDKGGRIQAITLDATNADGLVLKLTWDNETMPAVEGSIRDLFGHAFGKALMQGLLIGQRDGKYYCYFPMPFDNSARVELINKGAITYNGEIMISYSDKKRDPATEGKFYAAVKQNQLDKDDPWHVFLDIKGRGHYVGTILYAEGIDKKGIQTEKGGPFITTLFFEGDDSTATDGIFRIHGTGSEDYFNGGWYDVPGQWDHVGGTLLSGCLGYSHAEAKTAAYRFFIADKIPFSKSIWHGIEHGESLTKTYPVNYTSVAFYYCERPKDQQTK